MTTATSTTSNALLTAVRRALQDVWSDGRLETIPEIYHPDYQRQDPQIPGISGHDGIKEAVKRFREGIPDLKFRIVEPSVCIGQDRVAAQYEIEGTHSAKLFSIPATHREFKLHGQGIWRVEDGLIREDWHCFDNLTFYQALGIVPCIGEELEYK